jgi:unsaturated rhamnogalacturonyl hydrolase
MAKHKQEWRSAITIPSVSALLFAPILVCAQSVPTQLDVSPRDNPKVYSGGLEVDYPTPYAPASVEAIQETLARVHAFVDATTPVEVVDGKTNTPASLDDPPPYTALKRTDLLIVTYEWGVTYSGMLRTAEVTHDKRYRAYVDDRLSAVATLASHAKKNAPRFLSEPVSGPQRVLTLQAMIQPHSLDDSGSMCAAMIKAHSAGVGGSLRPWIDNYVNYVATKQFRLADGTLARNRPLPNSLWLDDLYMSVPCLAQAGKLTRDARYFDDAAKQILQFADRMFIPERGLFMHGWVQDMDPHPVFLWGRANGWAIMAMVELLSVLPEGQADRARVLELFRAHARGLAAVQGHAGLWHQLLDRPHSYEETSASAMFVYALARGINEGWLDPLAYGPATSLGWNAVAKKVNAKGQVEGTCVGTGMGWDPMFYMYRPVHVLAAHGYGPVLLAGAEMIQLRRGKGADANQNGGVQFGRPPGSH